MPHLKPLDKLFAMGALEGVRVRLTKPWHVYKKDDNATIIRSYVVNKKPFIDLASDKSNYTQRIHLQHAKQILEILR